MNMFGIHGRTRKQFTARMRVFLGFSEIIGGIEPRCTGTLLFLDAGFAFVFHPEDADEKILPYADTVSVINSAFTVGREEFVIVRSIPIGSLTELAVVFSFGSGHAPHSFGEVIFLYGTRSGLAAAVESLLGMECVSLESAILGSDPDAEPELPIQPGTIPSALYAVRVCDPPEYFLLNSVHDGKTTVLRRCRKDLPVFVPFGHNFPLFAHLHFPHDDDLLLVLPEGRCMRIGAGAFVPVERSLASAVPPRLRRAVYGDSALMRIRIGLRLERAGSVLKRTLSGPSLWIIPKHLVRHVAAEAHAFSGRLREFDGALLASGEDTRLIVWNGGADGNGDPPPVFSNPDIQAYYRYAGTVAALFMPDGFVLSPGLEEKTLERLFNLSPERFLIVVRTARAGVPDGISAHAIPDTAFRPVRKAVADFHKETSKDFISSLASSFSWDFGAPARDEPVEKTVAKADGMAGRSAGTVLVDPGEEGGSPACAAALPENPASKNEPESAAEPDRKTVDGVKTNVEERGAVTGTNVKSYVRLLDEKASDFISRYADLTADDWLKYMNIASASGKRRQDSYAALVNFLFLQPRSQAVDHVSRVLGISPDWFWTKTPEKLIQAVFHERWDSQPPEEIIFRLSAFVSRFFRKYRLVPDSVYRMALSRLKTGVYSARSARLIWIYSRIVYSLTFDAQALEDGRIAVQNSLSEGIPFDGLPETVRMRLDGIPDPAEKSFAVESLTAAESRVIGLTVAREYGDLISDARGRT